MPRHIVKDRKAALVEGLRFYTGAPCPHCWGCKRYTSNRACSRCAKRARALLTQEERQTARLKDAARKRITRAQVQSPWESILGVILDG